MKKTMGFLEPFLEQKASLVDDSREVEMGDVFVARKGHSHDGLEHIDEAIQRGAAAIIHEKEAIWKERWDLPHHGVGRLSEKIGVIADLCHGSPSRDLKVVAVTGTKGKTTTAYWCAQILSSTLGPCGYVGTIGAGIVGEKLVKTGLTTPGSIKLHGLLADFASSSCKVAVIEASSHGIDQGRLDSVFCDIAVFTNLGLDHLDYHGTKERYLKAKARLFGLDGLKAAVVNSDDNFAQKIIEATTADDVMRCGKSEDADLCWSSQNGNGDSISTFTLQDKKFGLAMPVPGEHNVANLALAVASALKLGVSWDDATRAARNLRGLPGRLERIGKGSVAAYVDYAHTPEALEAALVTLHKQHPDSRLTCVFGCGGNRDRSKRLLMGKVAARLADRVIITTDNPRDEDPVDIARQAAAGANGTAEIVIDRAEAIATAISETKAGDVLLVAGKGDEQEIVGANGAKTPFNDARQISMEMGR